MDPISPTYPPRSSSFTEKSPYDASSNQSHLEAAGVVLAQAAAAVRSPGPSPARARANSRSSPPTSPPANPSRPPYSPTKQNKQSHSSNYRLDHSRERFKHPFDDDAPVGRDVAVATGFERESLRQVHDGVRREGFLHEMSDSTNVAKGDEVSYKWGGGRPGGEVTDVATSGNVTMETKNGNEVKKSGEPENPAVYIKRTEGHDVVKKASEIDIDEKKGDGSKGEEKKDEGNGEVKTGEKRAAEDDGDKDADDKKQKTDEPKENGETKKKGRPAKGGAVGSAISSVKKEVKKRAPKKAATESGEPRRSGRNAGK